MPVVHRVPRRLDGAAEHASQRVNLAAAGKAPIERILTFAAERGWRRLRLLSAAGTTYNCDYWAETPDGEQQPMLNVFHRDGDTIRHFWGSELFYAPDDPGQDQRHVGTLEPLWRHRLGRATELLTTPIRSTRQRDGQRLPDGGRAQLSRAYS